MSKNNPLLILTAIGLILLSLLLIVGGGWLVSLDGSWYYLLCGVGVLVTAGLLFKGKSLALMVFAVVLLCSTIWAFWEVGFNWWQLVPRLWVWFVIGVVLLLPWWRKPLVSKQKSIAPLMLFTSVVITFVVGVTALFTSPGVIKGQLTNEELTQINPQQVAGDEWLAYGGTNSGLHYSRLDQITPDNISKLQEVWRIQTGDLPTDNDPVELTNENTPLKVNDKLYTCTAHGWVLALEPETGKTLWKYDPAISNQGAGTFKGWAHMTCRGLSYYDAERYLQ